jgi:hypothetical protein
MEIQIPEILQNKDRSYYGELLDQSFTLLEQFYSPFKKKGLNSATEQELALLDQLLNFQSEVHFLYRKGEV